MSRKTAAPLPVLTPLQAFASNWRWDGLHAFFQDPEGEYDLKPALLPWRHLVVRGVREPSFCGEEVYWAEKDLSARLANSFSASADDRCRRAHWYARRTGGKGMDATAWALWSVRGDTAKEGLVLCHAFLEDARKRGGKGRDVLICHDGSLPSLGEIGMSPPWHHWSTRMLPVGFSDLHGDRMAADLHALHGRVPWKTEDLCRAAAVAFAVSCLRHELLHVSFEPPEPGEPKEGVA